MKIMKKSLFFWSVLILVLSIQSCEAQIPNAKTIEVKVWGNCGMCKKTIEQAGNMRKKAKVDWNTQTKMATITYNTKKVTVDQVLKRIAEVGYDNEYYFAPDEVYNNLHGCCQYERKQKNDN